jgi:hypothetical protein
MIHTYFYWYPGSIKIWLRKVFFSPNSYTCQYTRFLLYFYTIPNLITYVEDKNIPCLKVLVDINILILSQS